MPPSQGDSRQNQLTNWMPLATERESCSWISNTNPDTPVRRNNLEDNVEGGEGDGVGIVVVAFGNCDY